MRDVAGVDRPNLFEKNEFGDTPQTRVGTRTTMKSGVEVRTASPHEYRYKQYELGLISPEEFFNESATPSR